MVDELLILNPHKLSFSEAGLRIMITPHFSPRTRLSMAGRMLISEVFDANQSLVVNTHLLGARQQKFLGSLPLQRQRLIQTSKKQRDSETGAGSTSNSMKRSGSCGLENGGRGPGVEDMESGDKLGVEVCQPEEEDDKDGIFSPVRIPGEEDPA